MAQVSALGSSKANIAEAAAMLSEMSRFRGRSRHADGDSFETKYCDGR